MQIGIFMNITKKEVHFMQKGFGFNILNKINKWIIYQFMDPLITQREVTRKI